MDEDDQIISRYTRAQAIEDGVLVDVTEQAKETGLLLPSSTKLTDLFSIYSARKAFTGSTDAACRAGT